MKMKWSESQICADLNESKLHLNVRDETNAKLFEIAPKLLLRLSNDEEGAGDSLPNVGNVILASTGGFGNRCGVAVNHYFLILNSALDQVEQEVKFDANIDFVIWRRSILIIGLASSKIMLLNPTNFEIGESQNVCSIQGENPDRFFVDACLHSNPDPSKIDFIAMGVDGVAYSFSDIALSVGSLEVTHDENYSIDIDISTIKGTARRCLPQGTRVLAACSPGRGYVITGDETGTLSIFNILTDGIDEDIDPNKFFIPVDIMELLEISKEKEVFIKKLVRFEGILFLLLSNGRLEILLDAELFPIGKFSPPGTAQMIHDFEIVVMNSDVIKLWVIFSNMEEDDHYIGIASIPGLTMEFRVRIPTSTLDDVHTTFRFPTSASVFDEPDAFIELDANGSTKVYKMEELSTDISLQNLLLKGKFDKAELLAKKYGKDLDLVWTAKLNSKYAELLSAKSDAEAERLYSDIIKVLALIRNPEFVCAYTIQNGFARLKWVKELLEIGLKRVGECSGTSNARKFLITVKKFYTFDLVVEDGGIERWNEFNSENTSMFLQCLEFLQNMKFTESETIWMRHCDEFLSEVELPDFAAFFRILFWKRLDSPPSVSLFKTIFPYAVEKCESQNESERHLRVSALLSLINNQIRALEREALWPEEGIIFTSTLLNAVEEEHVKLQDLRDADESNTEFQFEICEDILARLRNLIQALDELKLLKHAHSIRIAFDKYITDSKTEVINSMLGLLFSREEVEIFVKDFLIPFASRNSLDVDKILAEHIAISTSNLPYFMASGSIPFEERVVTLVEFIECIRVRLECILKMTKEWPVPWLPEMEGLVKRALRVKVIDDPAASDLQKLINLIYIQVPFRCLIQKYKLSASKLTIGYNIIHTIKRILRSEKENCYEDCLELIKHSGKCEPDEVRRIKFWYDLSETSKTMEEVLGVNLTPELMRGFLTRILGHFRQGSDFEYRSDEPWDRYTECGKILANKLGDTKIIQFFQLRSILKNLWSEDIIYSQEYPFSVLQIILEEQHDESSEVIIKQCKSLSQISFYHVKDILVTAGAFFCQTSIRGSALTKAWDFVTEIVRLPGNCHTRGDIVPYAGLRIAHYLILFAPVTTTEQLEILQDFFKLLFLSYKEEVIEPITKLFCILSIFQQMRDKEIPLENEFLSIYKEVWREGCKGIPALLTELETIGQSVLRFGEINLFTQIFKAVEEEYLYQADNTFGPQRNEIGNGAEKVKNLRIELLENIQQFQVEEKNQRVLNLVKSLDAAGLTLNAFALRQMNKARLIQKLLDMKVFSLASQTALVFDFRDGPSWSAILREYIKESKIGELKTLLESLKKISEVWVLPEFKEAWIKVSTEQYPAFRHMCPIPLDK